MKASRHDRESPICGWKGRWDARPEDPVRKYHWELLLEQKEADESSTENTSSLPWLYHCCALRCARI